MPRPIINLTGLRFGRLLVQAFVKVDHGKDGKHPQGSIWRAICDCGTVIETKSIHLRSGATKSCGCAKLQKWKAFITKHGESSPLTPEYRAWNAMLKRCRPGKSVSQYHGDRGIKVCGRWKRSFDNFLSDMGRKPSSRHSLDRKNTNDGYAPANCRWATPSEQQRNRRDNVTIKISDETMSLYEWSQRSGVEPFRIYMRLRRGWEPRRAVFKAVLRRKKWSDTDPRRT